MKKVLTVLNKYYKMLSTSDIGRKVTLKISVSISYAGCPGLAKRGCDRRNKIHFTL